MADRNLLRDVQDAALDPTQTVADVLRKCLVLAYSLNNPEFRAWAEHELEGYPPDADLPPYRKARGDIYASLAGPLQGWVARVAVPLSQLPEDDRERLRDFSFGQGVAQLEALSKGESGALMRSLPMELCARVTVYIGWSTVQMWSEISDSKVKGVLDIVRTRALKFALELQAARPESDANVAAIPSPVVHQVFQTVIQGGVVNLAQGSAGVSQEAAVVNVGDLAALSEWIAREGALPDELHELETLLRADVETKQIGAKTQGWLKRVSKRIATSGGRIAESTVAATLAAGIKAYLGI